MVTNFPKELGKGTRIRVAGHKIFDNGRQKYFEQSGSFCEGFEFANGPLECPISAGQHKLTFDLTFLRDESAGTKWMLEYHFMVDKSGDEVGHKFMTTKLYFDLIDAPHTGS
ncbi:hypothetical protein FRC12_014616 [Ceratobasidium sp. 428]|nr:hypothetical protein FRC12_014616 [Ceratobasidium sp. 428]